MSEESSQPTTSALRPAPDSYDSWLAYWKAKGTTWRTEPEIDVERQRFLAERRAVQPDIEQGIYPFKDIKLSRADVEWLLLTHENERGPVRWEDEKGKPEDERRAGLDLRGADLRNENLRGLPLARLRGGLTSDECLGTTPEQREMAASQLEQADLGRAHLEGASLIGAHLEGANLSEAHLEGSSETVLPADLRRAFLSLATRLDTVMLGTAEYGFVRVADVRWSGVNLAVVPWTQQGRQRRRSKVVVLGDERQARQPKDEHDTAKDAKTRLAEYETAVRANRQLATALRDQGLNEDADRFAYRAQLLQREVLRRQGSRGRWLFSWFLAVVGGYGYRLRNILFAYGITLLAFALAYFVVGLPSPHPMSTLQAVADAFQVSLTAIHGRVFFEQFGLGSALAWVAAAESVVGIVIEGVFVAMLVQRFFAR